MMGDDNSLAIIGLLMSLWLIAATVLIWWGLSTRQRAQKTLRQTARLTRLLETGPAVPVVVRSDGKLEASDRLMRMLGLERSAEKLGDLHDPAGGGISEAHLTELEGNVLNAQRSAGKFRLPLSLQNSQRRFLVTGSMADTQIYPNGAALLWFFDLTDNISAWEQAKEEATEARAAFTALSGLIEEAPIPMWHRDTDMKLTLVNAAYVAAVGGNNADEVVAQNIELVEPVDGRTPADLARMAMETGQTQERTVSSTIGGERRQVKIIDIPVSNTGVASIVIDVQELQEARSQYSNLAAAQNDLLDMLSSGVAQFDADANLIFANTPFQRMFALRDQWIDDQPEFVRLLDRMRENGKVPEVRDFPEWRAQRENWFRSAKGNEENWLLPDGTHLRVLAQPLPTGGLLTIFEDRTEQAQLTSARDILLRVRTATFDNLAEAIAVFSGDGRLSIWNSRFAVSWQIEEEQLSKHPRQDELLPMMASQLKKPAEISLLSELLRDAAEKRTQKQLRLIFADGRNFEVGTVPLPDGNVLFTMLNMTNSAQVEQALRERNEALSQADDVKNKFLANMSYEFRTPLTSISGFADLLKQGIGGPLPDTAAEYVDAIVTSASRLSQQINTVLDYSQSEAGSLPIADAEIALEHMLTALKDAHEEAAVSRGVTLRVELADHKLAVRGDEERLSQALGHIVRNAIEYGDDDGEVLIAAQNLERDTLIIVSDNGVGLSAPLIAQLTGDDVVAGNTNAANNGPGLGLPFARQIIEAHGGSLAIESQPGVGTSVIVTLPQI